MKTSPLGLRALLALALAAVFALPAQAAKTAELLSSWDLVTCVTCLDGQSNFDGGGGSGAAVFNGTFGDYQLQPRSANGSYYLIDLTKKENAPEGGYYISEIKVDTTGEKKYTVQYTVDGSTWTTVQGANNVAAAGVATYEVGALATQVKYIFDEGGYWDFSTKYIAEVQVWGYAPAQPEVLSSWDLVTCVTCLDGQSNFDGGGGSGAAVFNGTFGDYQLQPRSANGSYYLIDLTKKENAPEGGYYISEIKVDTTGEKKYTVQYTVDGSTWTTVQGANNVAAAGVATYEVGALATQVKYIFDEGGYWDFSTKYIAEVQVLGLDPADIDCTHPAFTEWAVVENSATCTERGIMERFCTTCNERFTMKDPDQPPLDHNYQTHLDRAGTATSYGSGYVDCSRCDFRIDFSVPVDLAAYGGVSGADLVQFMNLSVTSSDHPEWGPTPKNIIDGTWTYPENGWTYWISAGLNNQHVDFDFGVELDFTKVDISVHNHNQTLQIYSVDDTSGEEKLIGEKVVTKDASEGAPAWQRFEIFLYDSTKHLRLRTVNDTGVTLWEYTGMCVVEMHPYGTIKGANKIETAPMFILMQ